MQPLHLEGLDLNLLVALRALLRERHVTRAATRIGLSQPAMSHALARLRALLGDPLLVRTASGMKPTARAEAMTEPLERALEDIGRMLASPAPFDASRSTRRFRIATNDYIELVLLPSLLAGVWSEAPNVDIRVSNHQRGASEDLAEGRLDLAIGIIEQFGMPEPPQGIRFQRIVSERFVCVVREGHPLVKKRLTLDEFVALPHALVSPRGDSGAVVDAALAKLGRRRRVALEVPHFLVAPHVVRETDLVLTLAGRLADRLAPMLGLRRLAPPLELPGFTMSMVWHERQHTDPSHVWMRKAIVAAAKEI
ncbi:MAG TPA: LysR family transcriptional regulator [Labilithrix sp.]|nr:LysR family transcriptional regulator [Labilithrix sp.]